MRKGTKAVLWVVIIAAVVAIFGATAVKRLKKEEVKTIQSVQESEGIPVDYVIAQSTTVGDWRNFVGVAEGYEHVDLMADIRTRVNAVHAKVGDPVSKGTVIVSLDEYDPAWFAVNLGTSRARYNAAQRDSVRMEELYKSGAISLQELDHVRVETDRARAAYNTARRAVILDSPISGILTAVYVKGGEYAESGQTLATISSYRRIKVSLDVSATEVASVKLGQEVRIAPGESSAGESDGDVYLRGTVSNVSLSADPETRLFRIDLVVDNPAGALKPGALVSPQIKVASSGDGPAVPEGALLTDDGADMIYVIKDSGGSHNAELRSVKTGIKNGSLVSVTDGLRPGELVVVWGQGKLSDGRKVKLHDDLTRTSFKAEKHKGGLQ